MSEIDERVNRGIRGATQPLVLRPPTIFPNCFSNESIHPSFFCCDLTMTHRPVSSSSSFSSSMFVLSSSSSPISPAHFPSFSSPSSGRSGFKGVTKSVASRSFFPWNTELATTRLSKQGSCSNTQAVSSNAGPSINTIPRFDNARRSNTTRLTFSNAGSSTNTPKFGNEGPESNNVSVFVCGDGDVEAKGSNDAGSDTIAGAGVGAEGRRRDTITWSSEEASCDTVEGNEERDRMLAEERVCAEDGVGGRGRRDAVTWRSEETECDPVEGDEERDRMLAGDLIYAEGGVNGGMSAIIEAWKEMKERMKTVSWSSEKTGCDMVEGNGERRSMLAEDEVSVEGSMGAVWSAIAGAGGSMKKCRKRATWSSKEKRCNTVVGETLGARHRMVAEERGGAGRSVIVEAGGGDNDKLSYETEAGDAPKTGHRMITKQTDEWSANERERMIVKFKKITLEARHRPDAGGVAVKGDVDGSREASAGGEVPEESDKITLETRQEIIALEEGGAEGDDFARGSVTARKRMASGREKIASEDTEPKDETFAGVKEDGDKTYDGALTGVDEQENGDKTNNGTLAGNSGKENEDQTRGGSLKGLGGAEGRGEWMEVCVALVASKIEEEKEEKKDKKKKKKEEEGEKEEGQVRNGTSYNEDHFHHHPPFYSRKQSKLQQRAFRHMLGIAQRLPTPAFRLVMWCRRAIPVMLNSHRYRALLMSSFLLLTITLLSIPHVPERFLGIRSPEQVIESFTLTQNSTSGLGGVQDGVGGVHDGVVEGAAPPTQDVNKLHLLQKRQVPHKFWARARPHNKFKRKRRSKAQNNDHRRNA